MGIQICFSLRTTWWANFPVSGGEKSSTPWGPGGLLPWRAKTFVWVEIFTKHEVGRGGSLVGMFQVTFLELPWSSSWVAGGRGEKVEGRGMGGMKRGREGV